MGVQGPPARRCRLPSAHTAGTCARVLFLGFSFSLVAACGAPTPTVFSPPTSTALPIPSPTAFWEAVRLGYGEPIRVLRYGAPPLEIAEVSGAQVWAVGGGPLSTEEGENIHRMAEHGFRVLRGIDLWSNLRGHNRLDVYYDEEIQERMRLILDFHFYGAEPGEYYGQVPGEEQPWPGLDVADLWGVVLGDEEPGGFRGTSFYGTLSDDIAKYRDIYRAETGHELRPLDQMTLEEEVVFDEWLNEKTVWVYDFLYDYVKSRWPHLQVFQYMMMYPVWGVEGAAAYELRADGFIMDCYYAAQEPWLLYETIRRYETLFPERPFYMVLWGVIWDFEQMEGGGLVRYREGSLEQFRREAWIAYLAGADGIGWFEWGPQGPENQDWRVGWQRDDAEGARVYGYLTVLSRQLSQLPALHVRPEVLTVGEFETRTAMPNFAEIGLFPEYDAVSERAFAIAELDLSQYRLIVVHGERFREETVARLNEYVRSGGNVAFLGGTGPGTNLYETGPRETRFTVEEGATPSFVSGHIRIDCARANPLDLELQVEAIELHGCALHIPDLGESHHPICDFSLADAGGALTALGEYPLVLYRDEDRPESGWVLYWGGWSLAEEAAAEDEPFGGIYALHREIMRAFARFLGLEGLVIGPGMEDLIVTQALLDEDVVLAGIGNLQEQDRSLVCRLDLSRFGLPEDEYLVYSLDQGVSLGSFLSSESILEIPLEVDAEGTRLLLITRQPVSPGFAVDVFPEVPQATE